MTYLALIGITPFDPTPTGMWSNIDWASCSFRGCTSPSSKLVRSKRTPQLMSNPTPPTLDKNASEKNGHYINGTSSFYNTIQTVYVKAITLLDEIQ